jgi:hypothetical protein
MNLSEGADDGRAEEAAEKLQNADFSRTEAREKKRKERAYSARINPCPFKTLRKSSLSRSL